MPTWIQSQLPLLKLIKYVTFDPYTLKERGLNSLWSKFSKASEWKVVVASERGIL